MIKFSRYIIAVICLTIVVLRLIYPKLNFDLISLTLIAITSFAILVTKPKELFDQTKKIKLGSFEWELKDLEKEVEKVEKVLSPKQKRGLAGPAIKIDYPTEILKLSIEVEKKLRQVFEKHTGNVNVLPVRTIVKEMVTKNIIDREAQDILLRFFSIRNTAVHNHNITINKFEFLSFQDIGMRILKILENIENKNSEGLQHYGLD